MFNEAFALSIQVRQPAGLRHQVADDVIQDDAVPELRSRRRRDGRVRLFLLLFPGRLQRAGQACPRLSVREPGPGLDLFDLSGTPFLFRHRRAHLRSVQQGRLQ